MALLDDISRQVRPCPLADLRSAPAAVSGTGREFTKVRSAERLRDLLAKTCHALQLRHAIFEASISPASAARSRTTSAARSRVAAGAFGSSMIFSTVVAAAPAASCSRPMAWENTVRRASRHAAWNSGSFIHRDSVLAADAHLARSLLDASVGEQRGNRLLHLLVEFCSVS